MRSQLPDTRGDPGVALPAAQIALEAYWHVSRHLRIYAGQILVLAVISWFAQVAASVVAYAVVAMAGPGVQAVFLQLAYIAAVVTVLVLGGTAVFISCQRAIVLGRPPAVGHALKLRREELGVLRAVCVYWLIVHLVPTFVVNTGYVAGQLGVSILQMPTLASFAFYWGWVLAFAPLVVLSLPIALFEGAAAPLAVARRRLEGNAGRLAAASAMAFAPLAGFDVALYLLRDLWGPFDDNPALFWLVDILFMSILQSASSLAVILVMSALVAAAYLRLSPRLDSVYRVFD